MGENTSLLPAADARQEIGRRIRSILDTSRLSYNDFREGLGMSSIAFRAVCSGLEQITANQLDIILTTTRVSRQAFVEGLTDLAKEEIHKIYSARKTSGDVEQIARKEGRYPPPQDESQTCILMSERSAVADSNGAVGYDQVVQVTRSSVAPKRRKRRPKLSLPERIISALNLLGGASTAAAISKVLGRHRAHINRCLVGMVQAKAVVRHTAYLLPGTDRGRPTALYCLLEYSGKIVHKKTRYLIISTMVARAAARGYAVYKFDKEIMVLEFRARRNRKEPPIVLVIDDPSENVNRLRVRVNKVQNLCSHRGAKVYAAVADPKRITELSVAGKDVRIIDVRTPRETSGKKR